MTAVEKSRILIVEDEALVAEDLKMRLERLGYSVVGIVDRGEDVVAAAVEMSPDIVLLDIKLKGRRDGIDAGTRLRNLSNVPFVFVTSHADRATLDRACAAEPFGYLVKPFDEREVQAAIEMALRRGGVEQRLRTLERRMRAILTQIGDVVVVTDSDQRITFMNAAGEQLTRWPLNSALGETFERVFPLTRATTGEPVPNPVLAAVRTGTTVRLEDGALLTTRDGRRVPVDDTANPLRETSDGVSGAVVVLRDCSERSRLEAERRQVEQRLQEARLLESIGRVAGGLAHDFNNILAVILGNAQLLKRSLPQDSRDQELVHAIEASAETAARICGRLRDCQANEVGESEPIDLVELATETVDLLQVLFGARVRVRIEHAARVPEPQGDRLQLQQVLMNLLVNAAEAIGDAAGEIVVRIGQKSVREAGSGAFTVPSSLAAGDYAMLSVTDTGIGLQKEALPQVFDPFFSTKRSGRGLGLAGVLGIVRGHGGGVTVESEPGHGATFTVLVPLERARPQPVAPLPQQGPAAEVLIVDDETLIRQMIRRLCEASGVVATEVGDAEAALEELRRSGDRFAAVLLDLNMPGMNGLELARRIRIGWPAMRIAVITGSAGPADADLRGLVVLRKPFSARDFAVALRAVVPQEHRS